MPCVVPSTMNATQPRQQRSNNDHGNSSSFIESINSILNRFRSSNNNNSNNRLYETDIQCLSKSTTEEVGFVQLLVHVKRGNSSILIDSNKIISFMIDAFVECNVTIIMDKKIVKKETCPSGFDQTITFENKKQRPFEIRLEAATSTNNSDNERQHSSPFFSSTLFASKSPNNGSSTTSSYEETRIIIDENKSPIIESQKIKVGSQYMNLLEIYGQPTTGGRNIHAIYPFHSNQEGGVNATSQTSILTPTSTTSSNQECAICLVNVRNIIILPCRHMCICEECIGDASARIDKCPICRQTYDSLLKINYQC